MTSFSVEDDVEIRQSRARVYAFVSDHEHLPAWMAGVSRAKRETPGPVGVGTRYRVVGRMLGRRIESTYELTAFEPEAMFSGRLTSSLFEVEETYRFEGDGSTTRVRLTAEAQPGPKLRLLAPVLAMAMPRQVKADHRRLKTLLEARARRSRPEPAAPARPPEADGERGAGTVAEADLREG